MLDFDKISNDILKLHNEQNKTKLNNFPTSAHTNIVKFLYNSLLYQNHDNPNMYKNIDNIKNYIKSIPSEIYNMFNNYNVWSTSRPIFELFYIEDNKLYSRSCYCYERPLPYKIKKDKITIIYTFDLRNNIIRIVELDEMNYTNLDVRKRRRLDRKNKIETLI